MFAEELTVDRTPDIDAATRHLTMLTGEGDPIVDLQVFCDADKNRRDLARAMRGRFSSLRPTLTNAQQDGCGVFVALNETDGSGHRRKENITAARALFLDLDGSPLPDHWPEDPAMVMQTSSPAAGLAKYHCWWPILPTDDLEGWVAFQKFLAERYGGDPKCALTTQVGRLAGFWHQKNPEHPHQVTIVQHDENYCFGTPPTLSELAAVFGFDIETERHAVPDRPRVDEPASGWDDPADVDLANAFAADPDNWHDTNDGGVSIYKMACALRDYAVSRETAIDIITRHVPVAAEQEHIERKVANAYRYAQGDAGDRSVNAAANDFANLPVDENLAAEGQAARRKRQDRFKRWALTELMELPPPEWLVSDLIPEGGLAQVYGAQKRNKTFVTLDMALSVATGRPFHGVEVKQGRVTYVIGEGGAARFGDRILAWCKHNGVEPSSLSGRFSVVPVRVSLDNAEDLKAFLAADPDACALVVFDTLARCMDGDENSTRDMGVAVKGLDQVRERYGCAVIAVHHSGKDSDRGGRGSTALPGAVDATLRVTRDTAGRTVLTSVEMRDTSEGRTMLFEPVQVVIDKGDLRSSLAMRSVETPAPRTAVSAVDKVLVAIAERGTVATRADLVNDGEPGLSRANVHKAVTKLLEGELVTETKGVGIRATEEGIEQALWLGAVVPEEDVTPAHKALFGRGGGATSDPESRGVVDATWSRLGVDA